MQDQVSLRAAPRASAQLQATLTQGEVLEVRGERLDYLQVYDHKRERGGFVHVSYVYRSALAPADAPELLGILRFLRDTPGSEALGIGVAAAYLEAAPAEVLNGAAGVEALDALGGFADRLARRASSTRSLDKLAAATLSAHLDVAARYGITFATYEQDGRMQICYDGEAFRRVLAMPASAPQRARAALGLTRHECVNPDLTPPARLRVEEWRAEVLDRVDAAALPGYLKNRVLMRRAGVWAGLAYLRAREAQTTAALAATPMPAGTPDPQKAEGAAARAITELAGVNKQELAYEDVGSYADAAMRVNASRWAALPATVASTGKGAQLRTVPGQPGETCVLLLDAARPDVKSPLARRCTFGLVWTASTSTSRDGNALALAVQTMAAWRELWVFRKEGQGWSVDVLPPAATNPDVGYAEFAGWVPGGAQMLAAREARGEGKYKRSFEVIDLATLNTAREVAEPGMLSTFQRWQSPEWKRQTLSLR
ncbi:MAG TPA: SH3 domain-containing protein [Burkholderiales bacterium]